MYFRRRMFIYLMDFISVPLNLEHITPKTLPLSGNIQILTSYYLSPCYFPISASVQTCKPLHFVLTKSSYFE